MMMFLVISMLFLSGCAGGSDQSTKVAPEQSYIFYAYEDWDAQFDVASRWTLNASTNKSEYIEFLIDKTTLEISSLKRACETLTTDSSGHLFINDGQLTVPVDGFINGTDTSLEIGFMIDAANALTANIGQSHPKSSIIKSLTLTGYQPCP